jgi:hypothetical protein
MSEAILRVKRDPDNSQWGWVTCPAQGPHCEGERYVQLHHNLTGLCPPCSYLKKRTLTGEYVHPSRAIVRYDERNPPDIGARAKFAFICANPDGNPACMGKDFAWLHCIRDLNWLGRCKTCVKYRPNRKILDDFVEENGTKILLSQGEDEQKRVLAEYGKCKHQVRLSREYALNRRGNHPNRCRACFENPEAFAERLAALKLTEMMQQSVSIDEKRGRGRKPLDQDKFLSDFWDSVRALLKTKPAWNIKQEDVARDLQFEGYGFTGDGLRKQLTRCGVQHKWRYLIDSLRSTDRTKFIDEFRPVGGRNSSI